VLRHMTRPLPDRKTDLPGLTWNFNRNLNSTGTRNPNPNVT